MEERYQYYATLVDQVELAIEKIRRMPLQRCYDAQYLEHTLIPELGLNNEALQEQPPELGAYFGKGLHLWQYPTQLASYLVWLAHNARGVRKYLEIGCRWGGTFILVNEWLKKVGAEIEFSLAIDPIAPTPFIKKYMEVSTTPVQYIQNFSTSADVIAYLRICSPDIVFIDGDHSMKGVMFDHLLARQAAKIIVHHDIASRACPDSSLFWSYVRQAESDFEAVEFTQQYASVGANYLGIGVLKRR